MSNQQQQQQQQQFELLKTDNGHLPKDSAKSMQSQRSLIKSVELDSQPIIQFTPHKQPILIEPSRASELILNHSRKQSSKVPLHKHRLSLGPKYIGRTPLPNQAQDESPQMMADWDSLEEQGFSNEAWKYKALEIMMIILRFISFITKANFATSFRLITRQVFEIIGDKSANFGYYFFNDFFKYEKPTSYEKLKYQINQSLFVPLRKLRFYRYLHAQKFIMRPEGLISIGWNIYILTILNINVLYVSARLSFKFDENYDQSDALTQARQIFFDVLPSYSFLLEILLKFNTCYYHKGTVIENRLMIAKNYLRSSFFFDIFVIIPFFLSLRFQVDYLDLVLILKVFQIQKFSGNLFDRLELSSNQIALFDLIKLGYTILAAAHFCACLWFLVGTTGDVNDNSWVKAQGIQDENWISQYLHSFYFSIVTMTTIGYGDITPQSLRERMFTIGMAVAAVGTFGYSIGNINNIYAEWSRKSYQFRSDMNSLKKFLRLKKINKHLSEKIRKYFEYIWTDQCSEDDRGDSFKFTEDIPPQLLDEMKIDMYLKGFQKISFLQENFSDQFLEGLCRTCVEEKYVPEQLIYQQGEASEFLYFILSGNIQLFVNLKNKQQSQKILENINGDGVPFGQLEFFQKQCYEVSCKSTSFTYVLKIHRFQFVDLLMNNHQDYQNYCQLRDNVAYMGKQELVRISCKACKKNTHVIKDCPMVCGYPNRAKVLLNYRRNTPMDRRPSKRLKQRKIRTLEENKDVRNSVYIFISKQQNLTDELEEIAEAINNNEEILPDSQLSLQLINQNQVEKNKSKQRKLSFGICNDQLQDEDIADRVMNIISQINILEKYHQNLKPDKTLLQVLGSGSSGEPTKILRKPSQQYSPQEYDHRQNTKLNPIMKFDFEKIKGSSESVLLQSQKQFINEIEDEEKDKRMGQHIDIFTSFEKMKNYDKYMIQNNLNSIIKPRNNTRPKSQRHLGHRTKKE